MVNKFIKCCKRQCSAKSYPSQHVSYTASPNYSQTKPSGQSSLVPSPRLEFLNQLWSYIYYSKFGHIRLLCAMDLTPTEGCT